MSAALLQLALFAVEQLIKHAPEMYVQFREIFANPDITVDEIRAKREAIAGQQFKDFVPHSEA